VFIAMLQCCLRVTPHLPLLFDDVYFNVAVLPTGNAALAIAF
jgi:hypothetical protein